MDEQKNISWEDGLKTRLQGFVDGVREGHDIWDILSLSQIYRTFSKSASQFIDTSECDRKYKQALADLINMYEEVI